MVDPAGGKIGTLSDIYLDDDTAQPEWATVTTGLFGTRQSFVPLTEAEDLGDSVQVPYDRERVKNAPCMRAEGALSQDEEAALYRYYGLGSSASRSPRPTPMPLPGAGDLRREHRIVLPEAISVRGRWRS
jgi:hypothetical protein